jgi:hypothetical protein
LRRGCHNVLPFFVVSYRLIQPRFPFCHPARHLLYAQPPPLQSSFCSFPSRATPAAQGRRPALPPPGMETPEAPRLRRVCPTPSIARSFSKRKQSRTSWSIAIWQRNFSPRLRSCNRNQSAFSASVLRPCPTSSPRPKRTPCLLTTARR